MAATEAAHQARLPYGIEEFIQDGFLTLLERYGQEAG